MATFLSFRIVITASRATTEMVEYFNNLIKDGRLLVQVLFLHNYYAQFYNLIFTFSWVRGVKR